MHDAIKNIDVIHVNSMSQRILNKNICVLAGNVEVLVDYKMHICADYVAINKDKRTLNFLLTN